MTALGVFCLYLADSKQFLGIRYSDWCVSAPTLEASIAVTAMAQDELGHTRILYGILGDLPENPAAKRDPEDPAAYRIPPFLARKFPSWEDLVAASLVCDGFLTYLMRLGLESVHEIFATRMKKAYEEERFHRLYAEGWARWLTERPQSAPRFSMALAKCAISLAAHWERKVLPEILRSYGFSIAGIESALADFWNQVPFKIPLPEGGAQFLEPSPGPDEDTMRLITGFYRKVYGVG